MVEGVFIVSAQKESSVLDLVWRETVGVMMFRGSARMAAQKGMDEKYDSSGSLPRESAIANS